MSRLLSFHDSNEGGYTVLSQEPDSIDDSDPDAEFGGSLKRIELEQSLVRRLDTRMSILILIYILNYIDRNNVAAARLKGFEEDLQLKGQEFNTILSILYIGYTLMQVPSNMFLNHIGRPSLYLPTCMILWGGFSFLTGFARNFYDALILRFLLGFVEAAFFPGALFLLSKWYKRDELGLRTALLFCGCLISNAFGSLIASGILSSMEGMYGRSAWRWLFYVEGTITILVAFLSIFILPDFPANSNWLTPIERRLAEKRLEEEVGISDNELSEKPGHTAGLIMAFSDWKVWWLAVALSFMIVAFSFNAFFPTLTKTLGYSDTVTLLLCAPPWLVATVCAFYTSRHSDAHQERFYHIMVPVIVGILGFLLAASSMNFWTRYISLFLMAQMYSGFVTFLAWASNTIARPPSKRAVALAFINAFSQLGNIIGSYIWQSTWGPTYRSSYMICTMLSVVSLLMCFLFRSHLAFLNKEIERKEEGSEDSRKGFRYML
ncbi:sugar transporter [Schizopora paradoxa]|uniref:Sugar transporter n=1 Tax=Schizopora paradoxa TaxID=27342 RepID=A0A0H2S255_9AGAM|nr:sugar transporter [Schizopora paradoxa]